MAEIAKQDAELAAARATVTAIEERDSAQQNIFASGEIAARVAMWCSGLCSSQAARIVALFLGSASHSLRCSVAHLPPVSLMLPPWVALPTSLLHPIKFCFFPLPLPSSGYRAERA